MTYAGFYPVKVGSTPTGCTNMKVYKLEFKQIINKDIDTVSFFYKPENLSKITLKKMNFKENI